MSRLIRLVLQLSILGFVLLVLEQCADDRPKGLTDCLPTAADLENWQPIDTARTFVGEDLFLLINGGAEKYHEFGFDRVVSRRYQGPDDKQIDIEIFQMTDRSAATAIYDHVISGEGKSLDIGDSASLEDYYMNFRRGKCLVTLIGFDSEETTLEGIVTLARATDNRLTIEQ
jgi:hypothetical protein